MTLNLQTGVYFGIDADQWSLAADRFAPSPPGPNDPGAVCAFGLRKRDHSGK